MVSDTSQPNRAWNNSGNTLPAPFGQTGRTLLVLGRVSNVPTVWSNCLAGWWLGGGGSSWSFVVLCLGATLIYIGGMYLNDACDIEFDRQHRLERPIPSGAIGLGTVWALGILWLGTGTFLLSWFGITTFILTLLLISLVLLYDTIHKMIAFSPVLMAGCRFLLYLVAASVPGPGMNGLAIWSGLAMGAYIVGLSYIARKESTRGALAYWPSLFLAAPFGLALLIDNGRYRMGGILLCLLAGSWIFSCLRHTFWTVTPHVPRTVAGLLAGICWIDWLAAMDMPAPANFLFMVLFCAALVLQRFVPAT